MAIARGLFSGGYRKLLLLTVALFGALWLLGPSDRRKGVVDYVETKGNKVLDDYGYGYGRHDLLSNVRTKPILHPDPLMTTRCTKESQDPDATDRNGVKRPLVQYAVMIDAGSSGSRVHVYKFNFCSKAPELEHEHFEMLQGGLSDYANDPKAAASSLRPLLNSALKKVPKVLQSCSPIQVKATAGLRLIGSVKSDSILREVRRMLETEYPFPIADGIHTSKDAISGLKGNDKVSGKGIEIMEGRDEGVFAWITVNYLLNRIGSSENGGKKQQTAAVMDLGGGSTQIVFEPIFKSGDQGMREGEHVYKLENFGASSYTLYQNSYLGYGLMQARKSIEALTAFAYSISNPEAVRTANQPSEVAGGYSKGAIIPSPCFAEGRTKAVKIPQLGSRDSEVEVIFQGTAGGFEACKRFTEVMMNKDAVCHSGQCSFAGVYQPSLMKTFSQSPIIALSFFYDRLEPLGFSSSFTISQLASLAREVCGDPKLWSSKFPKEKYPHAMELLEDKPETCLDLTFMHGLLSLGYELDGSREINVAKKIGGTELGWCLGAQLAVLEEEGAICKR